MAANVYTSISSQTLSSNANTLSLSSFSGYTDLRIVLSYLTDSIGDIRLTFNSTGSGYGQIIWYGFGNTSGGGTSGWYVSGALTAAYLYGDKQQNSTSVPASIVIDVPYYARTDTNHFFRAEGGIAKGGAGADFLERDVNQTQWANTTAISTIQITSGGSSNFTSGTVVSVYGITEA
jgi:hypothetical protein